MTLIHFPSATVTPKLHCRPPTSLRKEWILPKHEYFGGRDTIRAQQQASSRPQQLPVEDFLLPVITPRRRVAPTPTKTAPLCEKQTTSRKKPCLRQWAKWMKRATKRPFKAIMHFESNP